jgi:hypothetical protein
LSIINNLYRYVYKVDLSSYEIEIYLFYNNVRKKDKKRNKLRNKQFVGCSGFAWSEQVGTI